MGLATIADAVRLHVPQLTTALFIRDGNYPNRNYVLGRLAKIGLTVKKEFTASQAKDAVLGAVDAVVYMDGALATEQYQALREKVEGRRGGEERTIPLFRVDDQPSHPSWDQLGLFVDEMNRKRAPVSKEVATTDSANNARMAKEIERLTSERDAFRKVAESLREDSETWRAKAEGRPSSGSPISEHVKKQSEELEVLRRGIEQTRTQRDQIAQELRHSKEEITKLRSEKEAVDSRVQALSHELNEARRREGRALVEAATKQPHASLQGVEAERLGVLLDCLEVGALSRADVVRKFEDFGWMKRGGGT